MTVNVSLSPLKMLAIARATIMELKGFARAVKRRVTALGAPSVANTYIGAMLLEGQTSRIFCQPNGARTRFKSGWITLVSRICERL